MSASSSPQPQGSVTAAPRKKSRTGAIVAVVVVVIIVVVLAGLYTARMGPFAPASTSTVPKYTVTFSENGLPTGATWSVTLGASTLSSTGSIVFSEKNGTYPFKVGTVSGYAPSPTSGNVSVNGGPQSETVTYTNTSSRPLGPSFGWGSATNATGTTPTGCPVAVGHYCYTVEITYSSTNTSHVALSLCTVTGATVAWPAGVTISLISPITIGAVATYSTTTGLWTLVAPFTGTFMGGMTLVIYTAGTGAANGLFGDEIVAIGLNGYTGTVTSTPFS